MLKTSYVKKQGNQKFTLKPLPSSPPLQVEKRSSQPSSELSSSGCLVVEKGRENERKWRESAKSGRAESLSLQIYGLIESLIQTKAYICSEKGKLQNSMKLQNYIEDILGRNKKL